MRIAEIFQSIQGETTQVGRVASFVRLAGCNLRCAYCDTRYAWAGGRRMSVAQVVRALPSVRGPEASVGVPPLVVITGGEPLLQRRQVETLAARLLDAGAHVMIETNGSLPVADLDPRLIRVVDWKCPGSGAGGSFLLANIDALNRRDQLKFVISHRRDYAWAAARVAEHHLADRCAVLFAPVFGRLAGRRLAQWMLADSSPARLQVQLQKILRLR